MYEYWLRQHKDEPLFPDIVWNLPQTKSGAGKLAIIGGNAHGFGAAGIAYKAAYDAGAGVVRALLPDAVKKIVSGILPDADFAPSTPSGSFARTSLNDLLSLANWGDGCVLAGNIGRNSETAIVLESFVAKYGGLLTITHDAVDYFKETPLQIVDRPQTLIALSLSQLQKVFINTPTITPITFSMSTQQLVAALHEYTTAHPAGFITKHNGLLFVAHNGKVTTQKHDEKIWRVDTATRAAVFWLQNTNLPFEAFVTALIDKSVLNEN